MRKILLLFVALWSAFVTMAQTLDAEKNAALQLVSSDRAAIGLTSDDLNNLMVTYSYVDKTLGVRYIYVQQTYRGIPIYNKTQAIAYKNNALVSVMGTRVPEIENRVNNIAGVPARDASSAVVAALASKGARPFGAVSAIGTKEMGRIVEFGKLGVATQNVSAQLMWFPNQNETALKLGWFVSYAPTSSSDSWEIFVDAGNGSIIGENNLLISCNWDSPKHRHEFGEKHEHVNGLGNYFDFTKVAQAPKSVSAPTLVNNVSYRVVPQPFESPIHMPGTFPGGTPGNSAIVNNPWTNVPASFSDATTLNWHSTDAATDFNYTRGNNVWAYHDRNNANSGDPARSATSTTALPTLNFEFGTAPNFAPNYAQDPETGGGATPGSTMPANQAFNVTNLFYWNNVLHDILYTHGFNEAARNFQINNLGRGGLGNDAVSAEAQDGAGTNNANMATGPDGGLARMQMFLWTQTTPRRDGDVDNGIIGHELGHGISERLMGSTTNQTGCANGNIGERQGEGISDYIGLMTTTDWAAANVNTGALGRGIGTFALGQPTTGLGIRTQRYSTDFAINNKKYQAILPQTGSPHQRGEHWCAAAWQATWAIIQQSGVISPTIYYNSAAGGNGNAGNVAAFRIAIQAMKLIPCGGGFIDHRNAWLRADSILYNGQFNCAIWEAFRSRGMGYFAQQGLATSDADQVPDETAAAKVTSSATPSPVNAGTNLTYTHVATTCSRVLVTGYAMRDTLPANVTFVSASNGGTFDPATRIVLWTFDIPANGSVTRNLVVQVNGSAFPGNVVLHTGLFENATPTGRKFNTASVVTPIGPVLAGCPTINQNPASALICNNASINFSVNASALNTITYQWQESTNNGTTWTNLTNTAPYSNVNTNTLTINPTAVALNNNQYRAFMTTVDCAAGINTAPATLNVVPASIGGTLAATLTTVCGATNTSTITLSGHLGNIVRWERSTDNGANWTTIANTTTTLTAANTVLTTIYRAVVQVASCPEVTSATVTINVLSSSDVILQADPGTTACVGDPVRITAVEGTTFFNTFSSTGAITINTFGTATPYPSVINVAGVNPGARLTRVTLTGLTHTFPDDIDMALLSPTGQQVVLMSDIGGLADMVSQNYIVTDSATVSFPDATLPANGSYRPTNIGAGDAFPAPGSAAVAGTTLSAFTGNMNGAWRLLINDDLGGDGGSLASWSLSFFSQVVNPITGGVFTWTPGTGLNSTTTNPVSATPTATTTYMLRHDNGAGCVRTANITININQRAIITTQPVSDTLCDRSTATFTVAATGTGPLTFQWQLATPAAPTTWVNVPGAAPYVGGNTPTLTINPVDRATMNRNLYRCVVSGVCAPVAGSFSNPARLLIDTLPSVAINPAGPLCGGVAGVNGTQLSLGLPPIVGTPITVASAPLTLAVPDNTENGVNTTLAVSTLPANATITNVAVVLNMPHTYPGDMIINLKAPNGQVMNLYKYNGGTFTGPASGPSTWGWYGSRISASGTVPFTSVTAPFVYPATATFRADGINTPVAGPTVQNPIGFAANANSFASLLTQGNGTWTLAMADGGPGDIGTLTSWSLVFDYTTPNPGGANPAYSYTWSPAGGLYNNATATIPYVAGTNQTTVYAAPIALTTYTATATDPSTGCTNAASVVVNYTPPAPQVINNPTNYCDGDSAVLMRVPALTVVKFTSNTAVPITDNTPAGATGTINVTGIPAGAPIASMKVRVNGNHTWFGDVVMVLKAPNNDVLNLDYFLNATGGTAATSNFVNTTFSSTATGNIVGTSPFTGEFRADGRLVPPAGAPPTGPTGLFGTVGSFPAMIANLNTVGNANGTYTLGVADYFAGDGGTVTSWEIEIAYGIPASKPTWSPITGLFNDRLATQPYTGDERDSVWVKRPVGTYTYNVTTNSVTPTTVTAFGTVATTYPANNGNALVTFNFQNTNAFPVVIQKLESFTAGSGAATARLYMRNTPLSAAAAPGAITAANGWNLMATNNFNATGAFPGTVLNELFTNAGVTIPANTTVALALEAGAGATGVLAYNGTGAGTPATTITAAGCSMITGPGIGFGGGLAPAAPTFTVRGFTGNITVARGNFCTSPVRQVTVNSWDPIRMTTPPADATACTSGPNNTVTFTATVTGTAPTYQWQVSSTNANSWVNVVNNANYAGATTRVLTITSPPLAWDANLYRCVVTGASPCGSVNTLNARLRVNPLPTVIISANPYTKLMPGLSSTLTSQSAPAGQTFNWTRDNFAVAGNTPAINVNVDGLGDYRLRVTDINGCVNTSNTLTIADSASGKVFIYPNPNNGKFQVRFYSAANNRTPRGMIIYDAKGDRIETQNFPNVAPYQRMDVDLTKHGKGVYWVELIDNQGQRLAVGRAVVL